MRHTEEVYGLKLKRAQGSLNVGHVQRIQRLEALKGLWNRGFYREKRGLYSEGKGTVLCTA